MAGAFFFPAGCMGLAAATHVALGGTLPPSPAAGHILLAALNFVLVFLVGGPLGEEFGWRGYALPALQRRWGWRSASLVLGGAWTLWHVPLFYSAGTVQSHLPMGLYALSAIASSVLFAWLFNRTAGSVLPVLVLHTAVNAWSSVIPVMVQPDGSNLRPFQWVVGTLVFAAVLLLLAPRRRPAQPHFSPDPEVVATPPGRRGFPARRRAHLMPSNHSTLEQAESTGRGQFVRWQGGEPQHADGPRDVERGQQQRQAPGPITTHRVIVFGVRRVAQSDLGRCITSLSAGSFSNAIEQAGSMMSSSRAMCIGYSRAGQPNSTGSIAMPAIGTCTARMYDMALRRLSKMRRPGARPPRWPRSCRRRAPARPTRGPRQCRARPWPRPRAPRAAPGRRSRHRPSWRRCRRGPSAPARCAASAQVRCGRRR
jgi:membrane protease YdiL (CAAX protease family)